MCDLFVMLLFSVQHWSFMYGTPPTNKKKPENPNFSLVLFSFENEMKLRTIKILSRKPVFEQE